MIILQVQEAKDGQQRITLPKIMGLKKGDYVYVKKVEEVDGINKY